MDVHEVTALDAGRGLQPEATRGERGDNLAISVEEPTKYKCWAGCTMEMIRAALGRPIPARRLA